MRMVVVLPAPFAPRKPNTSPDGMDRETPSRAWISPNRLRRPSIDSDICVR